MDVIFIWIGVFKVIHPTKKESHYFDASTPIHEFSAMDAQN